MRLSIGAFRVNIFHYWLHPHRDLSIGEDTYTPQKMVEDMSALESEEYAAQRNSQSGQGIKILTLNQMLSRLSITLAHLQAGNSSQKLENEIRQLCSILLKENN